MSRDGPGPEHAGLWQQLHSLPGVPGSQAGLFVREERRAAQPSSWRPHPLAPPSFLPPFSLAPAAAWLWTSLVPISGLEILLGA